MEKYQQIRVPIKVGDNNIRVNAETDKNFKFVKGIYISLPEHYFGLDAVLTFKIGQTELFAEHEVKLLSSNQSVAPNQRFYRFDKAIEAGGSTIEGRYFVKNSWGGEFDAIIYLWLSDNAN